MGAQPMPRPSDHDLNRFDHAPRFTLRGPAYEWPLWSTTVRVVTADPHALPSARRLVDTELAHVELAAGRRRDSEVATLPAGRRTRVSVTLTGILAAALRAAADTDGAVDPTRGRALRPVDDVARWHEIELDEADRTALVPRGVELDLDLVARAWAADRCASVVAEVLQVGVLVRLGGDIATAGPPGSGAWQILLEDPMPANQTPADPTPAGRGALVAVPTGLAAASAAGPHGATLQRATVVAPDCVTATTWSTAAVTGDRGVRGLIDTGLPARLVGVDGAVTYLGGWPEDGDARADPRASAR